MHLQFRDVRFGSRLEGHHALYVEAEREKRGTPVHISFSSGGKVIGEAVHIDGEGWVSFGWDTPELAGRTGELVAEVWSDRAERRVYCFEATTR